MCVFCVCGWVYVLWLSVHKLLNDILYCSIIKQDMGNIKSLTRIRAQLLRSSCLLPHFPSLSHSFSHCACVCELGLIRQATAARQQHQQQQQQQQLLTASINGPTLVINDAQVSDNVSCPAAHTACTQDSQHSQQCWHNYRHRHRHHCIDVGNSSCSCCRCYCCAYAHYR